MIEYTTAPSRSLRSATLNDEIKEYPKWLAPIGVYPGNYIAPTLGSHTALLGDVNYWTRSDGDIQGIDEIRFQGQTKKSVATLWQYGGNGSIFPPSHLITGFTIWSRSNVLDKNSMYLSQVALHHINDSGSVLIWGAPSNSRNNSAYSYVKWAENVAQVDRNALQGYKFWKMTMCISTRGGDGSNTDSELKVGRFQLNYDVGGGGNFPPSRWIVGAMRGKMQRNGQGAINVRS